ALNQVSAEPLQRFLKLPSFPHAFTDYVRRHDFVTTHSSTMAVIVTFISSFPQPVAKHCFDKIRSLLMRFVQSVDFTEGAGVNEGKGTFIAGVHAFGSDFDHQVCIKQSLSTIVAGKDEEVLERLVGFITGWADGAGEENWKTRLTIDLTGLERWSTELLSKLDRNSRRYEQLEFKLSDESMLSAIENIGKSV